MKRVCVFAGSSAGVRPEYMAAATDLGRVLAARGIGLVYGGARVGLMGAVADAVLTGGGEVTGVIPRSLVEKEVAHSGLTELRVVTTMHERKALMADLSDGFLALPGGMGTLDELFEILTLRQTGKAPPLPIILFDKAYWQSVIKFEALLEHGMVSEKDRELARFADSAEEVWSALIENGLVVQTLERDSEQDF